MPKKILLADDSITIQKVVELTFSDGDYEVTAVNNGARAVQKLSEMRPDIILSDIIMPEKNGYEVCEYVKSHPEYRNIPVVLLTGTFEPFDPDRADKAGCDAVVTKPFESQSLIHKVEELIEAARSAPATTAPVRAPEPEPKPAPAPAASPWSDEPEPPAASPSAADIFSSPARPSGPTTEMPFGQSSPSQAPSTGGGETRAFPATTFGDQPGSATTQQFTPPTPAAPKPEPEPEPESPWSNVPSGGETRAFPKMNFEDMQRLASEKAPEPAAQESDDSPFGASPGAEQFSGETRAFPKFNFNDIPKSPEPPQPAASASEPEAEESSPWDAPPPAGETRAFPQMNFEQLSQAAAGDSAPEEEEEEPASTPFAATSEPAEPETEEPAWSLPPGSSSEPVHAAAPEAGGNGTMDLSEEQVDRIARRVVQLMSDQVVRNIAWEVIPDMAEMVVKERIRQLESES
ncbi:MAG TPA: response regulator [Thermoanaerobaculia bacterium]|nr:response regulator [Thermoanaerobaculia bacterium]